LLAKDGYTLTEDGRITGGPKAAISESLLASLTDPAAIHDHLERITAAIERGDPAQAIGSAKEPIESTAKLVLRQLEVDASDKLELLIWYVVLRTLWLSIPPQL
jgi:hypothetical protein